MPENESKGVVRVPEDYPTINEAYKRIEQSNCALTTIVPTIVLGKGHHFVDEYRMFPDTLNEIANYLEIKCPVKIVGSRDFDKSDIVVVGGFEIGADVKNVHVKHLTIKDSFEHGVSGRSNSSFTLNDIDIINCGLRDEKRENEGDGVHAIVDNKVICCNVNISDCVNGVVATTKNSVVACRNVNIRNCKKNGVYARHGGKIIFLGKDTLINDNCLSGGRRCYELNSDGMSTIQIVKPLTKEAISKGNKEDRNFNNISRIEEFETKGFEEIKKIEENDDFFNIENIEEICNLNYGGGKCRRRKKQFRKTKTKRKKKSKRRRKTRKSKKRHKKQHKSKKRRKTKKNNL